MMDVRRKIPIAILDYLCALCCLQSGGQRLPRWYDEGKQDLEYSTR